jgi:ketosteroid isomerase-like protein
MQPNSVDVVREIIDAFNRGDIEAMLARMDPDFKWSPLEDSPVSRHVRGHEQVRHYVEDWLGTFDDLRMEVGDLNAVGDQVVVELEAHGRGRASGVELHNSYCQVWTLRDGRAVRMGEYATRDQWLAALAD